MPASVAGAVIAHALIPSGATLFGSVLIANLARAAIGFTISSILRGKPSHPQEVSAQAQNRLDSVRSPVAPRQVVYGEVRTAGALTYLVTSSDGDFTRAIFTFSAHPLSAMWDIFFDGTNALIDAAGTPQGSYFNNAAAYRSLGDEAGQPFEILVNEPGSGWTDAHRQSGCGKVYVVTRNRASLFPRGLPNVTALVRGRAVYDPRYSPGETRFSRNPALILADYLTSSFGLAADYSAEIDEDALIAAANICDEEVALSGATAVVTANAASDAISLVVAPYRIPRIGDGVRFSSTGSLPGGVSAATTYYVARRDETTFHLATSRTNALAGTIIDLTSAGSGTITMTYYSEARYSLDGTFLLSAQPKEVIGHMLAAMAGELVNVGGKWYVFAGAYEAPTITLDENDSVGPLIVQAMLSRRENANAVKGTFIDPSQSWQVASFPPIESDTYRVQDNNERLWKDIELPLVTSGTQAQRIAKIELLTLRQGLTVRGRFRLAAYRAMTGRTVALDNDKFGWTGKPFKVTESRFYVDRLTLGVELTLRETAAAIYDWSTSEEQTVDLAPNTTLVGPPDVQSLSVQQNGAVVVAQWPPVQGDAGLLEYEIRFSAAGVNDWDLAGVLTTAPAGLSTTTAVLVPGPWRYYIKGRNRYGYSATAAQTVADTTSEDYLDIASEAQAPDWPVRDTQLRFGGTTADYLDLGGNFDSFGAVAFWFAPEELPASGYATLLSSVSATAGFALRIDSATGKLHAYLSDGSNTAQGTVGDTVLEAGQSYHVIVDVSATAITVYLDGEELGTLSVAAVSPTGWRDTGFSRAGVSPAGTNPYKGTLDELLLYIDNVTAEEAEQIYLGEEVRELDVRLGGVYVSGCLYQLGFDEGTGTSARSRNGINGGAIGTLTGDVTWVVSSATSKLAFHHTGKLMPIGRRPWADYATWDDLPTFCPDPFRFCRWEASAIDKTVDAEARVYGPVECYLIPGAQSGRPFARMQMKVADVDSNALTGYPPWQDWTIGLATRRSALGITAPVTTFRYLRSRLVVDTREGVPVIAGFTPSIDAAYFIREGKDVAVTAGSPSGTPISFDDPFHDEPTLQLSMADNSGNVPGYVNLTTSGFTAVVKNSAGAEVAGTINWLARGA